VLRTGYDGPLSLEVFNDTFRQTDPGRTARQALRSLRWLEERARQELGEESGDGRGPLPAAPTPAGVDFVEVKGEDTTAVEVLLEQLGFEFRGRHRSKPVRLWTQGGARIVCNEQRARGWTPRVAAVGFDVPEPARAAERAARLLAPPVPRRTYAGEEELRAVAAPDGTEIFFANGAGWVGEFDGGAQSFGPGNITAVDHINLVQPWQFYDEAVLFYRSVLSLEPQPFSEVASPGGLVRSQVVRTPDGSVRLPLNLLPAGQAGEGTQHIALACHDVVALATGARDRGLRPLRVPDNYYDDLVARFDLEPDVVSTLRTLGLFYDRDAGGEYLHFYTDTVGGVFLEVVERRGRYDGYGAADAPVRLAAQSPQRRS
jgi:4-hydroxyphenylpyruvate dioxygenase